MPKIMYNDKNYSMGVGAEPDAELNGFSENPIQNKVVTEALNNKLNISDIVFATKQDIDELFSMQ